ncbi:MAG: DUF1007 family protein [Rhodobacteraceae bacterium]|nr:DUF1007 family protein [Paracoccaceae bacterium]
MKRLLACLLSLLPAAQAVAHPHVFVDTTLRVVLDDNQRVTGIELHWAYDEFFTLMLLEEMGLDPDGDGVLTEDELAILQGFELDNWPEDFEGDIYLYDDGRKLAPGTPEPRGVTVEDGRILSAHFRPLEPVAADGLEILQYDPSYYVAYTLDPEIAVPAPCRAEIVAADLDAAEAAVQAELMRVPEDQFEVLEVGIHYADRIMLTCEPSS